MNEMIPAASKELEHRENFGIPYISNKPITSFDRMNVRRLLIEIKRNLTWGLDSKIAEPVDALFRADLLAMYGEMFEDMKMRKLIDDYRIISASNNPSKIY